MTKGRKEDSDPHYAFNRIYLVLRSHSKLIEMRGCEIWRCGMREMCCLGNCWCVRRDISLNEKIGICQGCWPLRTLNSF